MLTHLRKVFWWLKGMYALIHKLAKCSFSCSFPTLLFRSLFIVCPKLIFVWSHSVGGNANSDSTTKSKCEVNKIQMLFSFSIPKMLEHWPVMLTLGPSCSLNARGLPWVTASFLLWLPWEQQSVFPSKLSGALHHIKQHCHESVPRSTGSLTIAELTAYSAACRRFNAMWFPIWPSWLRYFQLVQRCVFVFCINS